MFRGIPDRFRMRPGDTASTATEPPDGRGSKASRALAAVGTASALAVSVASHPPASAVARAGEVPTRAVSEETASTLRDSTGRATRTRTVPAGRTPAAGPASALPAAAGHRVVQRFSARPAAVSSRAARLNWPALARCESGGNPRAVSPNGRYRGLYQFSRPTWRSVGGAGDPARASSREQTTRAQMLYDRAGHRPWPVCGRRLYT